MLALLLCLGELALNFLNANSNRLWLPSIRLHLTGEFTSGTIASRVRLCFCEDICACQRVFQVCGYHSIA